MIEKAIKIRSSIKTSLKRYTLLRGSLLAVAGASILLFAGSWLPVDVLKIWGLPLLICGGGLITLGLLPYRKLSRLETKPNEIIVSDSCVHFVQNGKPMSAIPQKDIQRLSYLEQGRHYGICLLLKKPSGVSLFFPYFSESAFEELKDLIEKD